MKKETKQVDFDLSKLSLNELINLYEKVAGFITYLEENKLEDEKSDD